MLDLQTQRMLVADAAMPWALQAARDLEYRIVDERRMTAELAAAFRMLYGAIVDSANRA